jgi:hypothetical protein
MNNIINGTGNFLSLGYSVFNSIRKSPVIQSVKDVVAAAAAGIIAHRLYPDIQSLAGYPCTTRTFNEDTHFIDETENCGLSFVPIAALWMAYGSLVIATAWKGRRFLKQTAASPTSNYPLEASPTIPRAILNITKGVLEDLANGLNLWSLLPMGIDLLSYRMGYLAKKDGFAKTAMLGMLIHQIGTKPLTFDSWMFLGGFLNQNGLIADYALMDLLALVYASAKSLEMICHAYLEYQSVNSSLFMPNHHKIRKLISSSLLAAHGTTLFCYNCRTGLNHYSGMIAASQLDERQSKAAREFRVIRELGVQKPCNAVVFFGFMNDAHKSKYDRIPHPDIQRVYQECQTHLYRVGSGEGICRALADASTAFGKGPDAIIFKGHRSTGEDGIRLFSNNYERDYVFQDQDSQAVKCIRNLLRPNEGQVILSGCNTAFHFDGLPSMADRLSEQLPDIEVLGTTGASSAERSWIDFQNGKFRLNGACHQKMHWSLSSSVVHCERMVRFTEMPCFVPMVESPLEQPKETVSINIQGRQF